MMSYQRENEVILTVFACWINNIIIQSDVTLSKILHEKIIAIFLLLFLAKPISTLDFKSRTYL